MGDEYQSGLASLMRRVPKLLGRVYLPASIDSPYGNLLLQGLVVIEINSAETESLDSSLRIHMAHLPTGLPCIVQILICRISSVEGGKF